MGGEGKGAKGEGGVGRGNVMKREEGGVGRVGKGDEKGWRCCNASIVISEENQKETFSNCIRL